MSYQDPWLGNSRQRLVGRVELLNSRSPLYATHGRAEGDAESLSQGLHRTTGGVELGMPIAQDLQAKLGVSWQRALCLAQGGERVTQVLALCNHGAVEIVDGSWQFC